MIAFLFVHCNTSMTTKVQYIYIILVIHDLRDMIKNSKQWAQARGLCETNEVHGKEEWRIPTERLYQHTRATGTTSSQEVSFQAEDLYHKDQQTIMWLYVTVCVLVDQ